MSAIIITPATKEPIRIAPCSGTPAQIAVVAGVPGPSGLSAYEVAVANGFAGTEVEWLASLQAQGGVVAGVSYQHIQSTPSAEWIITHNLGFRPNVQTTDTSGAKVEGRVSHPSLNQTQVTFSAPFGGRARCS